MENENNLTPEQYAIYEGIVNEIEKFRGLSPADGKGPVADESGRGVVSYSEKLCYLYRCAGGIGPAAVARDGGGAVPKTLRRRQDPIFQGYGKRRRSTRHRVGVPPAGPRTRQGGSSP